MGSLLKLNKIQTRILGIFLWISLEDVKTSEIGKV